MQQRLCIQDYVDRLGSPFALFKKSFYVDEFYRKVFVLPLEALSRFIGTFLEPKFFEGMIWEPYNQRKESLRQMQAVQSGQLRSYFAWMVLGSVFLIVYFVL